VSSLVLEDLVDARYARKQDNTILYSEWCTWSHIRNSKNAHECTDVNNLEDCKYCTRFLDSRSCYDIYSWWQNSELCYESVAIGENNYGVLFCANVDTNSKNVLYSVHCSGCDNVFGCGWLRNKSYCIFNKQYTKEEYEKEVAKIITHMQSTGERWEFFDPSLSPFGYNETVAQEYYPLDQAASASLWYNRSTYEAPKPVSDKVIQAKDLPDTIESVSDDIVQSAIACEVTGKLFRILPQELAFYRKHNIPLPRKHPDQRHLERLALRR
jgi:hypothetical protein